MTARDVVSTIGASAVTAGILMWAPVWIGLACAFALSAYWCWLLDRRLPAEPVPDPRLALHVARGGWVHFNLAPELPDEHP